MHTEAPTSVTYTLTSPSGYSVLYTVRGTSGGALLEEMDAIENSLVDKGYKSKGGGKSLGKTESVATPTNELCPKCNAPLVEKTIKDRPANVCSTNVWDPDTRTATVCDYMTYTDVIADNPTPKQMEVLKDRGLYKEGMSRTEASDIIQKALGK